MSILVDSSVWIAYFRGGGEVGDDLDFLIDENLAYLNDLILAEIVPPLRIRGEGALVRLINQVSKHPMEVDWEDIIRMQVTCLRNGINKVGVPDLIIAQHSIQNGLQLFTLDRHFRLMRDFVGLELF